MVANSSSRTKLRDVAPVTIGLVRLLRGVVYQLAEVFSQYLTALSKRLSMTGTDRQKAKQCSQREVIPEEVVG